MNHENNFKITIHDDNREFNFKVGVGGEMIYTCKYCGCKCNSFILSERAHVCHRCGTLRRNGIELDISLFWNRQQDEDYFNYLDMEFDS